MRKWVRVMAASRSYSRFFFKYRTSLCWLRSGSIPNRRVRYWLNFFFSSTFVVFCLSARQVCLGAFDWVRLVCEWLVYMIPTRYLRFFFYFNSLLLKANLHFISRQYVLFVSYKYLFNLLGNKFKLYINNWFINNEVFNTALKKSLVHLTRTGKGILS